MKKLYLLFILFFYCQFFYAQIEENLYELGTLDNLLTEDVKQVIDQNITKKPTVFLGEAVHYSGSDLLAKTKFVKYLVKEHGYKDIVFESDFFALLFDHSKNNLYKMWASSDQCKSLMTFLKEKNITIWGFDNQMHAYYSHKNFTNKLSEFLSLNEIEIDNKFLSLTDTLIKRGYDSRKVLSKNDIAYLSNHVLELLSHEKVKLDATWTQILENYKSTILIYTVKDNYSSKNAIPIRDAQMAKNLDFIVKQNPDKKFIVWLANGHMSKCDYDYMNGQTMGAQFRALNPNTSYHIAFGSIKMPPERSEKSIMKATKDRNSILSYLPIIDNNYFLNADKITSSSSSFKDKMFNDVWIFNLHQKKAQLLNHFDALVFIAGGIEVSYGKE